MILRRLGNKTKIADEIQKHFPPHKTYVEPFFGAGGMFFNKQKAKYNILNDLDSDVFNLFMVLRNQRQDLYDGIYEMPIDETLWQYWRKNKETEPIKKALRFILLSNFGYMGKSETLRFSNGNSKKILMDAIQATYNKIWDCEFMNADFKDVFSKIPSSDYEESDNLFAYCDPPYLDTTNNYETSFSEEDSYNLFETLTSKNIKWAMSEFDHPFIMNEVKNRGLNCEIIGERVNMKNRRTEVLITNYKNQWSLFD